MTSPLARPTGGTAPALYPVLAIDPGNEESAFVLYDRDTGKPHRFGKIVNDELLTLIAATEAPVVVEQVACMGMAVGAEVFETVFWSGRFCQQCEETTPYQWFRVKRHEVKQHLCGNQRAKDANIRQALIDLYGGKAKAIGKKKTPGPLYGIAGDVWSALAVAVTFANRVAPSREVVAGGGKDA